MSLDAIKKVTETEEFARQAKAAAESAAKKLLSDAEQNGKLALETARAEAETVVQDWTAQAESQAAVEAEKDIAQAKRDCERMRSSAADRLDDVAAWIVRRVVDV
jgi:vacuolar-type H+-ATPase subunit H